MHRYQVAKYVIFDSKKIFVKNILASKENFTKIKKIKKFKMRL
jgi:mRNA-degrading endonuclease HigB of HigAB toxin-antitoxin module